MESQQPQQIELTAKRFKAMQAGGVVGFLAGAGLLVLAGGQVLSLLGILGILLSVGGIGCYAAGRIAAWWAHG